MSVNKISEKNKLIITVSVITGLFALLYSVIPLSIDDFMWGGKSGEVLVSDFFAGYNGRYLSNLITYIILRNKPLRVVFMSLLSSVLCFQVSKFSTAKKSWVYFLLSAFILYVTIILGFAHQKANLVSQTLCWTSGFTNYVMPVVFFLTYLLTCEKYYYGNTEHKKIEPALMFAVGVCSSLIIEHVTFYCVAISAIINFFYFVTRKRKIYLSNLLYFIGTVAGALIMFSNSSYGLMAKGQYHDFSAEVGYRKIGFLGVHSFNELSSKLGIGIKTAVAVIIAMLLAAVIMFLIPIFVTKKKEDRAKLYFDLISIILLTFPLLFANGGHTYMFSLRVYFAQYVFITAYIIQILSIIMKGKSKKTKQFAKVGLVICCCLLSAFYAKIYYGIHNIDVINESYIKSQKESSSEVIEVVEYPGQYSNFVFVSDHFNPGYKEYYDIEADKEIVPISYEEYLNKIRK